MGGGQQGRYCWHPTARGPCRRQVSAPGMSCGTDHPIPVTAATYPVGERGPCGPSTLSPLTAAIDTVAWADAARYWRRQAERVRTGALNARTADGRQAARLEARVHETRAGICDRQGLASWPGLYFGSDGLLIRANARLVTTGHGSAWLVFEPDDYDQHGLPRTIKVADLAARRVDGYEVREEQVPSWAKAVALSASAEGDGVDIYRLDGGRVYTTRSVPHPAVEPARDQYPLTD